jgi:hypothetical protein
LHLLGGAPQWRALSYQIAAVFNFAHDQGEAISDGGLRCGWVPLCEQEPTSRYFVARTLRCRWQTRPRRLYLDDNGRGPGRSDTKTGKASRPAVIHGQSTGRSESVEHRAQRRMGATSARACRRGAIRPRYRRPFQAWRKVVAVATRQAGTTMHVRPNRAARCGD